MTVDIRNSTFNPFPLIRLIVILFLGFLSESGFAQALNTDRLIAGLKELSSAKYEGRKTGTRGAARAAKFIQRRYAELGVNSYQGSYRSTFTYKEKNSRKKGRNVIGWIPGRLEKAIVISAHYDHLGKSASGIFYGADDNASGVAALLALAEYFRDKIPNHTLIFAAFDAEESGLRGARAFVSQPPVGLNRVVLNINMDMISRNDRGELYVAGGHRNPWIKRVLEPTRAGSPIKMLFGHDHPDSGRDDWTMQSDQGTFAEKNIPFIYFGVEDHPDYHQTTDTFERIDKDFYAKAVETILDCVRRLDAEALAEIAGR